MSIEDENCIFGEEYGRCPVIPRIIEMRHQAIQAMKAAYGDRSKDVANMMTSVMSTPILNLSQYCQACPKIPKRINIDVGDLLNFIISME